MILMKYFKKKEKRRRQVHFYNPNLSVDQIEPYNVVSKQPFSMYSIYLLTFWRFRIVGYSRQYDIQRY
jgi:hypothetical protein